MQLKSIVILYFLSAVSCNWWLKLVASILNPVGLEIFQPDSEFDMPGYIEMNDVNFLDRLQDAHYQFIYFSSDSCKFCRLFDPEFASLEKLFHNSLTVPNLQLVKVNAPKNRRLSELFQITKYPTLLLLNSKTNEIHNFQDERSLTNVMNFISSISKVEPNYQALELKFFTINDNNLHDFLNDHQTGKDKLIVLTSEWMYDWGKVKSPSHFYQNFPALYKNENIDFAIALIDEIDSLEILKHFKISNTPSILFIKNSGQIKEFNTCENIQMARLTEDDVHNFVKNLKDTTKEEYGVWFNDLTQYLIRDVKINNQDFGQEQTEEAVIINQQLEDEYQDLISKVHL